MAGLFLLNVINLPSRIVIYRLKLLKSYYGFIVNERDISSKEPIGPLSGNMPIVYFETELFGYIFECNDERSKNEKFWHEILKLLKESEY